MWLRLSSHSFYFDWNGTTPLRVAAADRAGTLFAIAAVLGAVATPFLIAEALGRRGRGRIAFTVASVLSVGATLFLALAAFLNLVVQCLE